MIKVDLEQIIQEINNRRKRVKYEFQELGLMLASKLNDPRHKALYMKLAKYEEQELLMDALHYVLASQNVGGNVGALFMWKLKELKFRPVEPVRIRFVLQGASEGYFHIGEFRGVKRGDLPTLLAVLREYAARNPEKMIYKGNAVSFEDFGAFSAPMFESFGVIARLKPYEKWVWKGEQSVPTSGEGEFMLDKPVLTKRVYTRRIHPV